MDFRSLESKVRYVKERYEYHSIDQLAMLVWKTFYHGYMIAGGEPAVRLVDVLKIPSREQIRAALGRVVKPRGETAGPDERYYWTK